MEISELIDNGFPIIHIRSKDYLHLTSKLKSMHNIVKVVPDIPAIVEPNTIYTIYYIDFTLPNTIYNILSFYSKAIQQQSHLVYISPNPIPFEISSYFVSILYQPTDADIDQLLNSLSDLLQYKIPPDIKNYIKGLDLIDIENILILSCCENLYKRIHNYKVKIFNRYEFIQLLEPYPIGKIGGLTELKIFLNRLAKTFYDKYRYKAILLTGKAGTGKTTFAKAIADYLKLPLVKLNLLSAYSKYVGETEKNIQIAVDILDKIAPCIILIDEIDKVFANALLDNTGITQRVLSTFLQFLQDNEKNFIVATANRIEHLPPELVRKGRFDKIFYIDIPTKKEREEIWKIKLSEIAEDYLDVYSDYELTGAEIETLVKEAYIIAKSENKKFKDVLKNLLKEVNSYANNKNS